jgi:hypothetical protein
MLITTKKPTGLPYGSGSLQVRGRMWWMIYKDGEGQTIQESAGTQDWDEAVRLLAARALPIALARVAALEKVAYEKGRATEGCNPRRGARASVGQGRGSRAVPNRNRPAKKEGRR